MCLVPVREGLSVEVPPLLRLGPFGSSLAGYLRVNEEACQ